MRPGLREAVGAALPAPPGPSFAPLNSSRDAPREQLQGLLSSSIALLVLLLLLLSLLAASLLTYCSHKWQLRGKRLRKAHEEYQRDQGRRICQSTSGLVS